MVSLRAFRESGRNGRVRAGLLPVALLALLAIAPRVALAQNTDRGASFETTAKQALLLDYETRTVLFERNADQSIHPASLAKIMTAALAFRELKEGRLKPEQDMVASTDAWRRGGAVAGGPNMLITPNKVVKVGELLTGLVVGSANDAAIVLAENISGTEARFTEAMNAHARDLGLANTRFANATGLGLETTSARPCVIWSISRPISLRNIRKVMRYSRSATCRSVATVSKAATRFSPWISARTGFSPVRRPRARISLWARRCRRGGG